MKYATWQLSFDNSNYGTGPEFLINQAGGNAEGSWSNGQIENRAIILGYITGDFEVDLSKWNYQEVSQEDALLFAQNISEDAFIDAAGKIVSPEPEI